MNKQLITVIADRQQPTTNTSIYKLYVSMPFIQVKIPVCFSHEILEFWTSASRSVANLEFFQLFFQCF